MLGILGDRILNSGNSFSGCYSAMIVLFFVIFVLCAVALVMVIGTIMTKSGGMDVETKLRINRSRGPWTKKNKRHLPKE